jgi:hypothetical protein
MQDIKFAVTASLSVAGALGISDSIAIAPTVTVTFTMPTYALTNGNPSNTQDYGTTTIRGPDIPYTVIDPPFTVSGTFGLDLDINGNCVFGFQIGSITIDQSKHVRIGGPHLGC